MAERITFSWRTGAEASGAIALPAGSGKAPAVIVVQEWWGVNDHIRSLADRLAAAGFVALAPDLYHGTIAKDAAEAGKMMGELDRAAAMSEIAGAAQFLEAHPRGTGKVGIIGFCMGGAFSLSAAALLPDLSAAVSFYGIPPAGSVDFSNAKAPVQAHFSQRDQWATPAAAEALQKELAARGQSMELFLYDADHAFVNDTRPEVYAPEAAKLAWDRAVAFLHEHLG
jgi:carboxymethylenebutenolidase